MGFRFLNSICIKNLKKMKGYLVRIFGALAIGTKNLCLWALKEKEKKEWKF